MANKLIKKPKPTTSLKEMAKRAATKRVIKKKK